MKGFLGEARDTSGLFVGFLPPRAEPRSPHDLRKRPPAVHECEVLPPRNISKQSATNNRVLPADRRVEDAGEAMLRQLREDSTWTTPRALLASPGTGTWCISGSRPGPPRRCPGRREARLRSLRQTHAPGEGGGHRWRSDGFLTFASCANAPRCRLSATGLFGLSAACARVPRFWPPELPFPAGQRFRATLR
jgi:hypothetical protein